MIDLSVSWDTTSPAYKSLPEGPGSNGIPSAMSADGQKWFALVRGEGHVFDIQTNTWTVVFNYTDARLLNGRGAATDPATGTIFIPFVYKNQAGILSMLTVDLKSNSYQGDSNTYTVPDQYTYAVTWNAQLKSLLLMSNGAMYTYTMSGGWETFNSPSGIQASSSSCMVSSGSGSKVVLFGGYSSSLNATVGDIFILDVPTLTWKKGTSTPPRDVRRSAACALSGDYFIVWGGDTGAAAPVVPAANMMLVYSLRTDQWVSSYIAPQAITNPPGNNTSSGSSTGVIIGAIGGGLAIGLVIGGLYGYSRKRRSKSRSPSPTTTEDKDIQPSGNTGQPSDNMAIQLSGNWDTQASGNWDTQASGNWDTQASVNWDTRASDNWDTRPSTNWDIQPPSSRNPHESVARTHGKVGTVQLGSVGSKPDSLYSQYIALESKIANP
ncbi:hypothetical protein BGX34_008247 [Mortierella sp. NVP85]|nr:hypothetical protein BGX34_008247 [Mortierella sp. NVP85]